MNAPQQFEYQQNTDLLGADVFQEKTEYAGFWLRFAAYIIDTILLSIFQWALAKTIGLDGSFNFQNGEFALSKDYWVTVTTNSMVALAYFVFMESSRWQGTLGKRAVGIKVTDLQGNRIGLGRALGRYLGKIVSAFTLLIGYIMAGFTERKQALHDMMASTLVVKS
jgi:uncharacterized RDD family membrane protein YckC